MEFSEPLNSVIERSALAFRAISKPGRPTPGPAAHPSPGLAEVCDQTVSPPPEGGCFNKAYVTSLLLTGSMAGAEAAVLESIRLLDVEEELDQALIRGAVRASVATRGPSPDEQAGDSTQSSLVLPLELQRLLGLATGPRQCFVLRFLVDWPRETCARLLHLAPIQVDEEASTAVRALARIAEGESSN